MNKNDIKFIINKLFQYKVPKGALCPEGENNPIIIVGPSGSEPGKFRVYANGGQILSIPYIEEDNLSTSRQISFADSKYSDYLIRNEIHKAYDNGRVCIYRCPDWLYSKYSDKSDLSQDYKNLKRSRDKTSIIKNSCERVFYLDVMVAATENKYYKHFVDKEKDEACERFVQTEIAKKLMKRESGFVVTDIEYCFSSKDKDNKCKPDIIVFDGESFGLIELKFNGNSLSTSGDGAGLAKHFNDFNWLVEEAETETKEDCFKVCLSRSNLLADYGIISSNWKKEKLKYNKNSFWYGFLFVDDDNIDTTKIIKSAIESESKKEIIGNNSGAFLDSPCWYCKRNDVSNLNFTKEERKMTLGDFLKEKK